jgi:hypothetical protein
MGTTCPFCGGPLGDGDTCARCGPAHARTPLTGWRPDPTARFEGRYYVTGRPTNRVRNGRKQSSDPTGGQMLPEYLELPASSGVRSTWLATSAMTAIVVFICAVAWILWQPHRTAPPPEPSYLSALAEAGLMEQFNSDSNAVAHGRHVCEELDHGGPQEGLPADKLAVEAFCPEFAEGFHVLETIDVTGRFELKDSAGLYGIVTDGEACTGAAGFSDIGPDTSVVVKNGKGEILHTTVLGPGTGTNTQCTFSYRFPITEGQDHYVVAVGRRGEFNYTFEQLRGGVRIHLGQ